MKKILLMLFAGAMFASCSTKSDGYQIEGNIMGLNAKKIYLSVYEGKKAVRIDSTEVKDGLFSFKGSVEMPMLASIDDAETGTLCSFFLENGDIVITGDSNFIDALSVKGSKTDELYAKVKPNINNKDSVLNFVKNNSNSVAAAYVLFRHLPYRLSADSLDLLSSSLTPEVQKSIYITILKERVTAMRKSEIGQPYMEINLPDTAGKNVSLSSVVKANKLVLIDFWASWCPPCRASNPGLVSVFAAFKDKGFMIYGVSLDKEKGPWLKAIAADELSWVNVSDLLWWDCAPAQKYGVSSIPSNFLISSADGKIIAKDLHGSELYEAVKNYLEPSTDATTSATNTGDYKKKDESSK